MGVKKSTVCSNNFPSSRRTAAASSAPSWFEMTELLVWSLRSPSTWARSAGPILHAQPDPWLNVVSLILSLSFIIVTF